jgi:hypothetical protein
VANHGHKKELKKILSRLNNLEASARRIAEDQRNQSEKWNDWLDISNSTFAMSTTWTSFQQIDAERQPASERRARWSRKRRMRQQREEMKFIQSSWASVASTQGLFVYQ